MNITQEDYKSKDNNTEIYSVIVDPLQTVGFFQKAFRYTVNKKPTLLDTDSYHLRYVLGKEELEEYVDACKDKNKVEVLDALCDQMYILLGTVISHGFQDVFWDAFQEVHSSNMSKLDDNGEPIINGKNGVYDGSRPTGKILKSSNFRNPNLNKFI